MADCQSAARNPGHAVRPAAVRRDRAEHFAPAFEHAMRAHRAEIAAIATSPPPPTFDNTLAALDRGGRALAASSRLFFNLAASETLAGAAGGRARDVAAARRAPQRDPSGRALFARIDALHPARRARPRRRAAAPPRARPSRFRARGRAAFRRPRRRAMPRSSSAWPRCRRVQPERAGRRGELPPAAHRRARPRRPARRLRAAAREAAQERGAADAWVITLSRSLIVPFLTFSDRRDLREQAFIAWTRRGENDGAHDNRPIAREILALRHELAPLHGYRHYADYALVDRMAGTPAAVAGLLDAVWEPAKASAAASAMRCGAGAGAGRDARDRALGLALLRREGAQGALRLRRRGAEAVFPARPHARRRVRLRASAVRHPLRRAAGPPRLSPGRSRVRSARRATTAGRRVPVRQLRAADQARRRVDERLPQPVARRRRDAADRRQQQQLRQGAGGRADAAVRRRRAHAVPRIRPWAARPAVAGDLRAALGHERAARLRRAAVADLRALGVRARGAEAPRAASRDGRADSRTS